ncbi:KH domain-containing protein [Tumebacillus sp. DT12]|uniref:RNA-binding protein KhpA n=1 Tax=Tumebacillus lacus TaxID=2995335 RepID=A0ABT3WW75_9BACL|nr:KH domain-containing protein [Tumebacillus lacus]MCX7568466.1 KH domain-containing protein [Tumebacillus lacus]
MIPLIETIAKALVDQPDQVRVTEVSADDKNVVYELSVAPGDMGKIIGKQGRIAKALRAVVSAAALQGQKRVTIEIV